MNEIKHAWFGSEGCLLLLFSFLFSFFYNTVLEFAVLVFSQLSYDGLN